MDERRFRWPGHATAVVPEPIRSVRDRGIAIVLISGDMPDMFEVRRS